MSVSGVSGALILSRDGLVLGAYPDRGREPRQAGLAQVHHARRARPQLRRVPRPGVGLRRAGTLRGVRHRRGRARGRACSSIRWSRCCWWPRRGGPAATRCACPTRAPRPPGSRARRCTRRATGRPAEPEVAVIDRWRRHAAEERPIAAGFAKRPGRRRATRPDRAASAGADDAPSGRRRVRPRPQRAVGAQEGAPEARRRRGDAGSGLDDEAEVDRVLLAKEFSGLLQVDSDDDEGSS